jgi:polysaccharide export outer membrane protein
MRAPGQEMVRLEAGSEQLPKGEFEFRVSALDTLQIDVFPKKTAGMETKLDFGNEVRLVAVFAGKSYQIAPGDTLTVSLEGEKDLDAQVMVRPDGFISLSQIGKQVYAVGLTPPQLANLLAKEYSSVMVAPRVTVSIVRSNLDQMEKLHGSFSVDRDGTINLPLLGKLKALGETTASLTKTISAAANEYFHNEIGISVSTPEVTSREPDARLAPDGQKYFRGSTKVSPEGSVFVPDAGVIAADGKTLSELGEALRKRLQQGYQNPIDVHVALSESVTLNVFIGGEVKQPGRYPFSNSMTLMQLIASAGWANETGDLENIMLLHQSRVGEYVVYTSNLKEIMDGTSIAMQDMRLTPRDIVIVPRTGAAKANAFVDQYIRRMLPFGISVNYNYLSNPQTTQAK